uniref:BED-type domain-containing protein n=1 Tax=Lactuca sativa TaxID=4236 RepID=A0A9R1XE75_LACSA|nr:hypothetical protein LSAT_V11C500266680 [Lactuca sativa]
MDITNDGTVTSECEFVSENEVATNTKRKKRKNQKGSNKKDDAKPPRPAPPSTSEAHDHMKKKRSIWWKHFEKTEVIDVVECIHCHRRIGCASVNGTTPLKNHVIGWKQNPENIDKKQKLIDLESKTRISDDGSTETTTVPRLWEFNPEVIRRALARMLIVDELPFSFVEREDCYSTFIKERKRLLNIFADLSSRVCLTTDTWTSGQNLIGHAGVIIGRSVEKLLIEWNLKSILTVTVDNASSNDLATNHLKKVFNHWEGGVLKGSFLHMRCVAHILSLVVKDGLDDVNLSIKKIRTIVKYVRSSPARLQKFKACIEEEKIESKSLVSMDVDTRWNSTFLMLEGALKFKRAFSNLLLKDSNCEKELKKCEGGLISEADWTNVSSLLPFLKIFFDATNRFSGSRYVTSNSYVQEIFGIGHVIDGFTKHTDMSVKTMAQKMQKKYKKYWGDADKLNQFLFIAGVLDPRRKWKYIEWVVAENFNKDTAAIFLIKLEHNMRSLFDMYHSAMPQKEHDEVSSISSSSVSNAMWGSDVMDIDAMMTKRFEMAMGSSETNTRKTELDKYLGEDREPMDLHFDILTWWKVQRCRYPIFSKMARDILAIPVSTVASESAFSTGGRVLDCFRTALTPRMVEALVCTQDWTRTSYNPIMVDDLLLEIEKIEEGLNDLTLKQPTIIIDEIVDETSGIADLT